MTGENKPSMRLPLRGNEQLLICSEMVLFWGQQPTVISLTDLVKDGC